MAHTEGWELKEDYRVMEGADKEVCQINPWVSLEKANTIAAAPELLAACKAMIDKLENLTTDEFSKGGEKEERERMKAAIQKAERGEG